MESEFIAWLRKRLPSHPRLLLGAGDDAALVNQSAGQMLVSVDVLTEGVDFRLAEVGPRRVGRKALAVNLSDMAAMAARPTAAVIGVVLPRGDGSLRLAQELAEGLIPLAEQYDIAIAGGDTNSWDGQLVISVTIFGEPTASGPLTRSGAQPGDVIIVTGEFGGSILAHQFDFEPRVAEAMLLHERYDLHAGIDVSDGLSLDLSRLAAASGCGAAVRLAQIPIAAAAHQVAARDGQTPLSHALSDGEDFELILAVPPGSARRMLADQPCGAKLTAIGEFVAEAGIWQVDGAGAPSRLSPAGFEH